jgi:hypothetical protein
MLRGGAFFLVVALLSAAAASGCGSSAGPASLSLDWATDAAPNGPVQPSASLQTKLTIRNDGGKTLDDVQLRFDETEGRLPAGVAVGTVTNASSSFDGDVQVWQIGRLKPGETVVFPIALWFETHAHTPDTLPVTLYMGAKSPDLEGVVLSNPFEVEVDGRLAVSGP